MPDVTLSGKLPGGNANGLSQIIKSLIEEPDRVHALMVLVSTAKLVTEVDTGETVPALRIRRVEVIRDEDLAQAQGLILRSWEERNGGQVLPQDVADEVSQLGLGREIDLTPPEVAE